MPSAAYPISKLILNLMSQYSCNEQEFVIQFLGYRQINGDNGVRRLRSWIETGSGPASIIKGIARTTQLGPELREAVVATEQIKHDEAEVAFRNKCEAEAGTFRPYLHVVGETKIPNGVTLFGATGGRWNLIKISSQVLALCLEEQLSTIPLLMATFLEGFDGYCPFFGRVTAFLFVRLLDYFAFDARGVLISHIDRPFRRGSASCSLQ